MGRICPDIGTKRAELLGLGPGEGCFGRLTDLLQTLAFGPATSFARLFVVGRPLHFGSDPTSLDELFESFQGAFDMLPRTKPHSQNQLPPAWAPLKRDQTNNDA